MNQAFDKESDQKTINKALVPFVNLMLRNYQVLERIDENYKYVINFYQKPKFLNYSCKKNFKSSVCKYKNNNLIYYLKDSSKNKFLQFKIIYELSLLQNY